MEGTGAARAATTTSSRETAASGNWAAAPTPDQARETLPALRQEVQTFIFFGVPPTTVRTDWMFGFQRRLVLRWEWEMLWPKPGPLPHTSHFAATSHAPNGIQLGTANNLAPSRARTNHHSNGRLALV